MTGYERDDIRGKVLDRGESESPFYAYRRGAYLQALLTVAKNIPGYVLFLCTLFIGAVGGSTYLLADWYYAGIREYELSRESRFTSYSYQVHIGDELSATTLYFREQVGALLKINREVPGFKIALPGQYPVREGGAVTYSSPFESYINGVRGDLTVSPSGNYTVALLGANGAAGSGSPLHLDGRENLIELSYRMEGANVIDGVSGRGRFEWSYPTATRPMWVDRLEVVVTLPTYAEASGVRARAVARKYGVSEGGFANYGAVLSEREVPAPTIGKVRSSQGGPGAELVQVRVGFQDLEPYEVVDLLVEW